MSVTKKELPSEEDFYPDVDDYLAQNTRSITSKGLEEFILRVRARTGLDEKIATEITKIFFEEIRSSMLQGDIVTIRGLGKFSVASPKNKTSKKKTFCRFKPYKKLTERLNDKD